MSTSFSPNLTIGPPPESSGAERIIRSVHSMKGCIYRQCNIKYLCVPCPCFEEIFHLSNKTKQKKYNKMYHINIHQHIIFHLYSCKAPRRWPQKQSKLVGEHKYNIW
jgi:hypothetical protein